MELVVVVVQAATVENVESKEKNTIPLIIFENACFSNN